MQKSFKNLEMKSARLRCKRFSVGIKGIFFFLKNANKFWHGDAFLSDERFSLVTCGTDIGRSWLAGKKITNGEFSSYISRPDIMY